MKTNNAKIINKAITKLKVIISLFKNNDTINPHANSGSSFKTFEEYASSSCAKEFAKTANYRIKLDDIAKNDGINLRDLDENLVKSYTKLKHSQVLYSEYTRSFTNKDKPLTEEQFNKINKFYSDRQDAKYYDKLHSNKSKIGDSYKDMNRTTFGNKAKVKLSNGGNGNNNNTKGKMNTNFSGKGKVELLVAVITTFIDDFDFDDGFGFTPSLVPGTDWDILKTNLPGFKFGKVGYFDLFTPIGVFQFKWDGVKSYWRWQLPLVINRVSTQWKEI